MMKTLSFRGTRRQEEIIEQAQEIGMGDNDSEATRALLEHAGSDIGIVNGNGGHSTAEKARLKRILDDLAEQAAYIGMAWGLVLTFYPSSSINWGLVGPILFALLIIVTKNMFVKYA